MIIFFWGGERRDGGCDGLGWEGRVGKGRQGMLALRVLCVHVVCVFCCMNVKTERERESEGREGILQPGRDGMG